MSWMSASTSEKLKDSPLVIVSKLRSLFVDCGFDVRWLSKVTKLVRLDFEEGGLEEELRIITETLHSKITKDNIIRPNYDNSKMGEVQCFLFQLHAGISAATEKIERERLRMVAVFAQCLRLLKDNQKQFKKRVDLTTAWEQTHEEDVNCKLIGGNIETMKSLLSPVNRCVQANNDDVKSRIKSYEETLKLLNDINEDVREEYSHSCQLLQRLNSELSRKQKGVNELRKMLRYHASIYLKQEAKCLEELYFQINMEKWTDKLSKDTINNASHIRLLNRSIAQARKIYCEHLKMLSLPINKYEEKVIFIDKIHYEPRSVKDQFDEAVLNRKRSLIKIEQKCRAMKAFIDRVAPFGLSSSASEIQDFIDLDGLELQGLKDEVVKVKKEIAFEIEMAKRDEERLQFLSNYWNEQCKSMKKLQEEREIKLKRQSKDVQKLKIDHFRLKKILAKTVVYRKSLEKRLKNLKGVLQRLKEGANVALTIHEDTNDLLEKVGKNCLTLMSDIERIRIAKANLVEQLIALQNQAFVQRKHIRIMQVEQKIVRKKFLEISKRRKKLRAIVQVRLIRLSRRRMMNKRRYGRIQELDMRRINEDRKIRKAQKTIETIVSIVTKKRSQLSTLFDQYIETLNQMKTVAQANKHMKQTIHERHQRLKKLKFNYEKLKRCDKSVKKDEESKRLYRLNKINKLKEEYQETIENVQEIISSRKEPMFRILECDVSYPDAYKKLNKCFNDLWNLSLRSDHIEDSLIHLKSEIEFELAEVEKYAKTYIKRSSKRNDDAFKAYELIEQYQVNSALCLAYSLHAESWQQKRLQRQNYKRFDDFQRKTDCSPLPVARRKTIQELYQTRYNKYHPPGVRGFNYDHTFVQSIDVDRHKI